MTLNRDAPARVALGVLHQHGHNFLGNAPLRLQEEQSEPMPRPVLGWEEPAVESYPTPEIYRSRETDAAQELERRLHRDSRRYDSGFFQY